MSLEGVFALLVPVAALLYAGGPLLPLIALAREREWLLASVLAVVLYVLPPMLVFLVFGFLNLSGSFTELASLLVFGPAVTAVVSVVLILLVYMQLWRSELVPRGRLI